MGKFQEELRIILEIQVTLHSCLIFRIADSLIQYKQYYTYFIYISIGKCIRMTDEANLIYMEVKFYLFLFFLERKNDKMT